MAIMKSWNGYEICDEAAREQLGGVTTAGTGEAYTATVKGVKMLDTGVSFIMVPHVASTSLSPTLDVNGLGARNITRRLSNNTSATGDSMATDVSWLAENKPIRITYDGSYWVVDSNKPYAPDIYGAVSIQNGGTGATTVAGARNSLGLGNTSGALPIANGGTGAVDGKTALNNLGISWGLEEAPLKGTPNTIYIQIK